MSNAFMDELAHSVGQDPVEFRRKLMKDHPKNLGRSECRRRKDRLGQTGAAGMSIAASRNIMGFGSYVAAAATEISVSDGNKIKVHRIVAATDPGYAVNPAQIERQVAGSFVYGLSGFSTAAALSRTVTSSRLISTPTTRCASTKCQRWKRF